MADSEPLEEKIFLAARDIDNPDKQSAYLDDACGNDRGLRARVERLLELRADADVLLERRDVPGDLFGLVGVTEADAPGSRPGQQVGRYKLLEQIGQGGFGAVWMAEQREPVKRRVALKAIKLGMDTKQVIARFEAERQALALMDHPCITKVFDAGITDAGRPYFVMELVRGVPFLDYCDSERLSTKQRLELFIQVCHAIQHAHQKGIIHRDIKPSNILVTLQDGKPMPKVIDFGIAKATAAELTEKTLFTQYGEMIGTPTYMSPEQAEMTGLDVDTRSDVYSLGVLLYELLTGATPFDREQLLAAGYTGMVRMIREQDPPRPSTRISRLGRRASTVASRRRANPEQLGVSLRGDLDSIVMKAMEKDRDQRYDTAQGFANDIERYLHDEPVRARTASTAYVLFKALRRHRQVALASLAFMLTILAGLIGTGIAWRSERRARKVITDRSRGQTLQLAYGAFHNRVDELSRQLLDRHVPDADSVRSLAWGFLDQRLTEHQPSVLFEFAESIESISTDPQGQFYAIGSVSGDILLVDHSGATLERWIGDHGAIMDMDFSRDGTLLAAACLKGSSILLRVHRDPLQEVTIERMARIEHVAPVGAVAILEDQGRGVSLMRGGVLQTWDFTGNVVSSSPTAWHPNCGVRRCSMSVSPDEKRLATHGWDGAVIIHSLGSLSEQQPAVKRITFRGRVQLARFSPDGARLVTGSKAGTQVWDVTAAEPVRLYDLSWRQSEQGHFSADDKLFAAEFIPAGALPVFDFASGRVIARFAVPHRHLAQGERKLRLVSLEPGRLIFAMRNVKDGELGEGSVIAAYTIPQEDHAWTATPAFWDPPMAVHPTAPIVACPDTDERIKLWNVERGTIDHLPSGSASSSNTITALAFSSDGGRLAVSRGEGANTALLRVWDVGRMEPIIEMGDCGVMDRIAFSPRNPHHLVTTGRRGVLLWDLSDHASPPHPMRPIDDGGHIMGVGFSHDGEILALGGPAWAERRSPPAQFWHVTDWSRPRLIQSLDETTYTHTVAAWPDTHRFGFVKAVSDPVIQVWDAGASAPSTITLSGGKIYSLALVQGGPSMVAASTGALRFIDAGKGEEIASFEVEHDLHTVRLMPAHRRLVASTSGGRILQWTY